MNIEPALVEGCILTMHYLLLLRTAIHIKQKADSSPTSVMLMQAGCKFARGGRGGGLAVAQKATGCTDT